MSKADDSANACFKVEHKNKAFLVRRRGCGRLFYIELEGGGTLPRELRGNFMRQGDALDKINTYQARLEILRPNDTPPKKTAAKKAPAQAEDKAEPTEES